MTRLRPLLVLLTACASSDKPDDQGVTEPTVDTIDTGTTTAWGPVTVDPDAWPPEQLSAMNLIRWSATGVEYNAGIFEYTLETPLFTDYALKARAVWMPEGTAAQWTDDTVLEFPVGTVIMKTFMVSDDLTDDSAPLTPVETRLLIRGNDGWEAWPYLWRADGTEADRHVSGKVFDHTFIDPLGQQRTAHYLVPQRNQCVDCHETFTPDGARATRPLGPEAMQMHDGSLLESLVSLGHLTGAPDLGELQAAVDWDAVQDSGVDTLTGDALDRAARDYLHVNCAHCHSPLGIEGVTSQFFLDRYTTDPFNLGVCKRPGSAGEGGEDREFDIVPGDPEASILWYRVATEDVGAMMPDIGRSLTDTTGAELIWRWIAEMEPVDCSSSD